MTVLKPYRASWRVLICGVFALSGCSDDDSPPIDPAFPDASALPSFPEPGTDAASPTTGGSGDWDAAAPNTAPANTSEVEAGVESTSDVQPDSAVTDESWEEAVRKDPDLTVLVGLVDKAQMGDELRKEEPFTLLAPTNDGWSRLPAGYLDSLSRKQAETLVRNHILPAPRSAAQLLTARGVASSIEFEHQFTEADGEIYVNGLTRMTARDKTYSGTKVHKVDSVLTVEVFPGTLADAVHAYPRLSELEARLSPEDLALLQDDDKTLFAPVNGGFTAIAAEPAADGGADGGASRSVIGYHVLPHRTNSAELVRGGVTRTADGAYLGLSTEGALSISDGQRSSPVLIADLRVESGTQGSVLHVVEEALVPPPSVLEVLQVGTHGETFASLLQAAASTDVPGGGETFAEHLASAETLSVFAPSDAAFGRVAGSFSGLDAVLGFHVMNDVVDSPRLLEVDQTLPPTLTTSSVKTFAVVNAAGTLLLDGFVTVVVRDVPAANGVVHVVDGVLLPRGATFPGTTPQALAAYPALSKTSDAVAATGLLTGVTSTLFAPYDAAFGPIGSFNDFVRQHAATAVVRDGATLGVQFSLLNGETISGDIEQMTVKGRNIVRADLLTASGVVHILDGVLTDEEPEAGTTNAND